jgi:hypothetical protein
VVGLKRGLQNVIKKLKDWKKGTASSFSLRENYLLGGNS